jgi:hypothetical protein
VGGDVKMSLDLDEAIKEDQLIEQAEVSTHPFKDISPLKFSDLNFLLLRKGVQA